MNVKWMGWRLPFLVFVFALVSHLSACVPGPPPGARFVAGAPPPAVVETYGVAPGPEFVWIPGHHEWRDDAWAWVAGSWEKPPREHAEWVRGRWEHERRGWYWVEGRWR